MATDKERLAILEQQMGDVLEERRNIRKVICETIRHVIYGAITLAIGGAAYSRYLLPEPVRKALSDWISR